MIDPAAQRKNVLETLERAVQQLVGNLHADLVPPEGVAFGYAIAGARDSGGVAAVRGGIRPAGDGTFARDPCSFGSDDGISRVILTAMKFDPRIRSAAVIAYSSRAKAVLCNDLFLETASSSPGPAGISTLDWGIASCCRDGVPDAIFCNERDGARARVLIFCEEPAGVLNNIIMCSNRI
jgi:hydroxymethylpyrimidine/phosphomethylpyrimidine kinase